MIIRIASRISNDDDVITASAFTAFPRRPSCPCRHVISRHFECSDVPLPAAFSILYNLHGNAENASLHNSSLSVLTYVKTSSDGTDGLCFSQGRANLFLNRS